MDSIINYKKRVIATKIKINKKEFLREFVKVKSDLLSPPPSYSELKKKKTVFGMGGMSNL